MISEGEKEEIRALIKVAGKRTLNFGVCIGEEPEETVLVMHRRNKPIACAREAKAEGTSPRVAKGLMEMKDRTLRLACEGRVPPRLAKELKKYLKLLRLSYKVQLVDEVSPLPDEIEEEEAAAEEAKGAPAAKAPASDQERYEAMSGEMAEQIEKITADGHPKAEKIAAVWDLAQKRAEGGDFRTANKAVTKLASLI